MSGSLSPLGGGAVHPLYARDLYRSNSGGLLSESLLRRIEEESSRVFSIRCNVIENATLGARFRGDLRICLQYLRRFRDHLIFEELGQHPQDPPPPGGVSRKAAPSSTSSLKDAPAPLWVTREAWVQYETLENGNSTFSSQEMDALWGLFLSILAAEDLLSAGTYVKQRSKPAILVTSEGAGVQLTLQHDKSAAEASDPLETPILLSHFGIFLFFQTRKPSGVARAQAVSKLSRAFGADSVFPNAPTAINISASLQHVAQVTGGLVSPRGGSPKHSAAYLASTNGTSNGSSAATFLPSPRGHRGGGSSSPAAGSSVLQAWPSALTTSNYSGGQAMLLHSSSLGSLSAGTPGSAADETKQLLLNHLPVLMSIATETFSDDPVTIQRPEHLAPLHLLLHLQGGGASGGEGIYSTTHSDPALITGYPTQTQRFVGTLVKRITGRGEFAGAISIKNLKACLAEDAFVDPVRYSMLYQMIASYTTQQQPPSSQIRKSTTAPSTVVSDREELGGRGGGQSVPSLNLDPNQMHPQMTPTRNTWSAGAAPPPRAVDPLNGLLAVGALGHSISNEVILLRGLRKEFVYAGSVADEGGACSKAPSCVVYHFRMHRKPGTANSTHSYILPGGEAATARFGSSGGGGGKETDTPTNLGHRTGNGGDDNNGRLPLRREGICHSVIIDAMDSTVYLLQPIGYVRIQGCKETTIVLPAVSGVVTVVGCANLVLHVATRCLRIENCYDTTIHAYTLSYPIITGDTRGVRIGPYNVLCGSQNDLMASARLKFDSPFVSRWAAPLVITRHSSLARVEGGAPPSRSHDSSSSSTSGSKGASTIADEDAECTPIARHRSSSNRHGGDIETASSSARGGGSASAGMLTFPPSSHPLTPAPPSHSDANKHQGIYTLLSPDSFKTLVLATPTTLPNKSSTGRAGEGVPGASRSRTTKAGDCASLLLPEVYAHSFEAQQQQAAKVAAGFQSLAASSPGAAEITSSFIQKQFYAWLAQSDRLKELSDLARADMVLGRGGGISGGEASSSPVIL